MMEQYEFDFPGPKEETYVQTVEAYEDEPQPAELYEEVSGYATEFMDITTISDSCKVLLHKMTGRVLHVRAEWQDANG